MKDPAEIARRLDGLQQKIGIAFKRPALLQEALSHSSFANENPSISPHDNERLEYLGDAVLQLISAEFLFKGRPGAAEGEMTQVRSSMVNTQALAALSEDLGMGEYLLLGKGIARGGGRNLRSLLANAFEAVLGAIFLDQGYDAAYHYCMERFRALPEADLPENFKGRLQHLVQDRFGVTPVYDAIGARAQSGRMREYTAVVYAGGDPLGTGHGRTKQVAEQTAAKEAIRKLTEDTVAAAGEPAELPRASREEPRVEEVLEALASAETEALASAETEALASAETEALASAETVEPEPAPAARAEEPPEVAAGVEEPPAAPAAEEPEAAAPVVEAPVIEPPAEAPGGGWRSRREVAERAAAERRRPRPQPEPSQVTPVESQPAATEDVAPPSPPPPVIPPGRQFGAPAAKVEVELLAPPPEVEHLVAAPATSRIPAEAAISPVSPRQFGQPVAEPAIEQAPEPEPPAPRRRGSRTSRTTPRAAAGAGAATPPADPAQPEATEQPAPRRRTSPRTAAAAEAPATPAQPASDAPKPARRRSTRAAGAKAAEVAEPAPGQSGPESDQPPALRRRTTRRRTTSQETSTE